MEAPMRALVLTLAMLLPGTAALAAIACPARLGREPPPPFERLGLGGGRGTGSALAEAWLVYGVAGDEMKPAPATSAPDTSHGSRPNFRNTWELSARDPMLLVCVYGAGQWLRAAVPPEVRSCVQANDRAGMTMRCE
jgi:hypothetical protein